MNDHMSALHQKFFLPKIRLCRIEEGNRADPRKVQDSLNKIQRRN